MGCFKFSSTSKTTSNSSSQQHNNNINLQPQQPNNNNLKHQLLLQIPECIVYLMEEGEAVELSKGELEVLQISDNNLSLATTIKVGHDLQWPLTKDEPVVKLDSFHYLFSLPIKNGDPLSYGVTFSQNHDTTKSLTLLDHFLKDHCCFSDSSSSTKTTNVGINKGVDWKEFAPRIDDYNGVLARAIAGGTGQIVRGIFIVSNAYTNQIQKGGEMILSGGGAQQQNGGRGRESFSNGSASDSDKKKSQLNKSLKRVRKMSKMTEKISKSMLDGVGIVTGSVMKPVVNSQAGKAFLSMVPGEVLLASLDAVNKIFDAAEVAEKQAFTATSSAATRMVSNRYGESAGEATGDALATAEHCANTAWNIFKIRKAINPASSVSSGLRTAALNSNKKS